MLDELSALSTPELVSLLAVLQELDCEVGHLPYGNPARMVSIVELTEAIRAGAVSPQGRSQQEPDFELIIGAQAYGLQLERPDLSPDEAEAILRSRYAKVAELKREAFAAAQEKDA